MRFRSFAGLLLLAGAGCTDVTSPGPGGGLEFTATVSRSTIRVGEAATFVLTLHNRGPEVITLHFPDSCQIMPYIADNEGRRVYPSLGWGCYLALTRLRMDPGQIVTQVIEVRGGAVQPTIHEGAQLAPGTYRLWGELGVPPKVIETSNVVALTVVE